MPIQWWRVRHEPTFQKWFLSILLLVALIWVLAQVKRAAAHDQHGNPNWIAEGRYTNRFDGSLCCGKGDCIQIPGHDVSPLGRGYFLPTYSETVPHFEVQRSQDGNFWRCKKPDGSRRCFFAPPETM